MEAEYEAATEDRGLGDFRRGRNVSFADAIQTTCEDFADVY
jgi:hypothetical protein